MQRYFPVREALCYNVTSFQGRVPMAKAPTAQKPATAAKPINLHKQMAGYKAGGKIEPKKMNCGGKVKK